MHRTHLSFSDNHTLKLELTDIESSTLAISNHTISGQEKPVEIIFH